MLFLLIDPLKNVYTGPLSFSTCTFDFITGTGSQLEWWIFLPPKRGILLTLTKGLWYAGDIQQRVKTVPTPASVFPVMFCFLLSMVYLFGAADTVSA